MDPAIPVPQVTDEFEILRGLIKEKGVADSEVQAFLYRWSVDHEQGIEQSANQQIQVLGQIDFEREKARLWKESGHPNECKEAFQDAAYIAHSEKLEALAGQIEAEIE